MIYNILYIVIKLRLSLSFFVVCFLKFLCLFLVSFATIFMCVFLLFWFCCVLVLFLWYNAIGSCKFVSIFLVIVFVVSSLTKPLSFVCFLWFLLCVCVEAFLVYVKSTIYTCINIFYVYICICKYSEVIQYLYI